MSEYKVRAYREDKWWMVEIPELDGLTQARRFTEVEEMARDYIAITKNVPLSRINITVTVTDVAGVDVETRLERIRKDRSMADALEKTALEETERLAKELAARKLTVREIGQVLDISFQRAHQLVRA